MRVLSRSSAYASALLLAGTAALAAPAAAQASAAQPGPPVVPCSSSALVAAIQHANSAGSATLLLSPGCDYVLTTAVAADDGLPTVTGNLTIAGSQGTTISRSVSAGNFRILHVAAGGSLTLSGVTLANGTTNNFGGGVLDLGTLTLRNVKVTGSSAAFGGGLFIGTNARATANFSEFTGNTAIDTGGAISAEGAALALRNVKLAGNTADSAGGALFTGAGQTTISFSSLTGNTSQGFGGGAINNASQLAIDHSTLSGNTARGTEGGGLRTAVGGTSQVSRTVVARNSAGTAGGGIANHGTTVLTLDRVVLNHATAGGGIANLTGTVSLRFTLVAFNSPDNCTPRGTIQGCLR